MLMNCWGCLKNARVLMRNEKIPRREGLACPNCHAVPPSGPLWKCTDCGQHFDTFETKATCPHCGASHPNTMCGECRQVAPISAWVAGTYSSAGADVNNPVAR
jgi:DNA-directed RNA polymerase subunit RPC12/RpoP